MTKSGKKQQRNRDLPALRLARAGRSFACGALLALAGSCALAGGASAQSSGEPSQIIAPTVLSIRSATESGLPIRVITPERNAFILIEGLPKTVALSTGRLFESGVWAVKVSELQELKIVAMVNSEEERDLLLSLKTLEGDVLAEVRARLRISPVNAEPVEEPQQAAPETQITTTVAAPQAAQPDPAAQTPKTDREIVAASPPVISEEDMESILLLMRKGSEHMQQGRIDVARLFYSRAADKGWADAAFSLARTYDAAELEKIGAIGVAPEPDMAAKWYRRAIELGATTAGAYLERLQ